MLNKIELSALVDKNGNLLLDQMVKAEMQDFAKKHKNARVVLTVEVLPNNRSQRLIGYYYKILLPIMQRMFYSLGERLTISETEKKLKEISPVMQKEFKFAKQWKRELREISELLDAELCEHIDTIKQYAAEQGYFIEDFNQI